MKLRAFITAALAGAIVAHSACAQLLGVVPQLENLMGANNYVAAWSTSSSTVTGGQASIDGNSDATAFLENTGAANHQLTAPAVTVSSGATVTFATYAKTDTGHFLSVVLFNGASSAGINVDTTACSVGTTSTAGSGVLTSDHAIAVQGSWCYITMTASISAITSYTIELCTSNAAASVCPSYTGTGIGPFIYAGRMSLGAN